MQHRHRIPTIKAAGIVKKSGYEFHKKENKQHKLGQVLEFNNLIFFHGNGQEFWTSTEGKGR